MSLRNSNATTKIPKFLREGTSAKDLRKQAKEIPKQELPKIKKDIA